jgi:hypothetical protein
MKKAKYQNMKWLMSKAKMKAKWRQWQWRKWRNGVEHENEMKSKEIENESEKRSVKISIRKAGRRWRNEIISA